MVLEVFSVYDSKAAMYSKPFLMRTKGEALRGFIQASKDKSIEIGLHPEDFSLFRIARFDDNTGIFENVMPAPENLGNAMILLDMEKNESKEGK